ncbi:hypothetical protein EVAR_69293_1 [Eumeta japonica]|uniref:Helitron helicase-like domain-containing protein n=1 Tax=Eumeta variegata TaxID=151549 RepID=A0A4C2AF93_EUMVA|nr:hypothetical protein EVAR_69293_1 [Eumeta japonica]
MWFDFGTIRANYLQKHKSTFEKNSALVSPVFVPLEQKNKERQPIQGQIRHRIGSLQPVQDAQHKFLQIYFMGNMRNMEEQIDRRQEINRTMKRVIFHDLQQLLHEQHALVRLFKTALKRMPNDDYKIVIREDKQPAGSHERTFNAPTIDEVAVLVVGENLESHDIVLSRRDTGQLQRIHETHRSYDSMQYSLMFW